MFHCPFKCLLEVEPKTFSVTAVRAEVPGAAGASPAAGSLSPAAGQPEQAQASRLRSAAGNRTAYGMERATAADRRDLGFLMLTNRLQCLYLCATPPSMMSRGTLLNTAQGLPQDHLIPQSFERVSCKSLRRSLTRQEMTRRLRKSGSEKE